MIIMPKPTVEERVANLERQVSELMNGTQKSKPHRKKDWRRTIGIFTDKPGVLEIFDEAMKLREVDRAKARGTSRRRAKA